MARGHNDWGRVSGGPNAVGELATYVSAKRVAALAGVSIYVVSAFNPLASGVLCRINRIWVRYVFADTAAGLATCVSTLSRTSDLGTGTAFIPNPTDTGDPAAKLLVRTGLTVAPTVTLDLASYDNDREYSGVAGSNVSDGVSQEADLYRHTPGEAAKKLLLLQGQGMAIQVSGTIMNVVAGFWFEHTEEPV